jgi:hypothetical protein
MELSWSLMKQRTMARKNKAAHQFLCKAVRDKQDDLYQRLEIMRRVQNAK